MMSENNFLFGLSLFKQILFVVNGKRIIKFYKMNVNLNLDDILLFQTNNEINQIIISHDMNDIFELFFVHLPE